MPGRVVAQLYMIIYGILWLVLGAHVIGAVLEEKHLFSNEEQERWEAVQLEIAQKLGIIPEDFTELPFRRVVRREQELPRRHLIGPVVPGT